MHFTLKTAIATSAMLSQLPLLIPSEVYPGAMAAGSSAGLWLPPCSCAVGYSFDSPSKDGVEIYLTFDEKVIPALISGIAAMGSSAAHGEGRESFTSHEYWDSQGSLASSSFVSGIDDVIASIDYTSDQVGTIALDSNYHSEGFDFSQAITFIDDQQPDGLVRSHETMVQEFIAFEGARTRWSEPFGSDAASPGEGIFPFTEEEAEEEITTDEEYAIADAFQSFRREDFFTLGDEEPEFEALSPQEESLLSKAFRSLKFDAVLAAFEEEAEMEELSDHEHTLLSKAFQSMPSKTPVLAFDKEVELEELSLEEEALLAKAFDSIRSLFPVIVFDKESEIEDLTADEEKLLASAFKSFDSKNEFLAALAKESAGKEISYNRQEKPRYLTASFVQEITEELVFRDIPKVEANPQAFDVPDISEEEDDSSISALQFASRSNEEMIAHLSGLEIDDDEFVAFNDLEYKLKEPPVEQQKTDDHSDFQKKLALKLKIKEWEQSLNEAKAAQDEPDIPGNIGSEKSNTLIFVSVDPLKTNQKKEPGRPKSSFSITGRPVTNAEYRQYLIATKKRAPSHWWRGTFKEGEDDLPVRGLSYVEAEAYAEWKGMRLPTKGELNYARNVEPDAGFDDPSWVLIEEKGLTGMLKKKQRVNQADPERCVFCVKS